MGLRPGRCHACGETGGRRARFCGRCGAHLAAGRTGAAGPHATPEAASTGARVGTGARRPSWWLAAGVVAVVGAVAAGLTGGLPDTGANGGDVELPDEEAIETDAEPGPRVEGGGPMTPAEAEFDCLVDEPCVRWRSDVDGLLDGRTMAHIAAVGGHTLVVRSPHGVAGLDLAGRVRWSRTMSEDEVLSTTRRVTATDEHVVLSTEQGRLHVLEVRTGERRWVTDQPSPHGLDGEADRENAAAGRNPPDNGQAAGEDLHLTNARQYGQVLLLAFQESWRPGDEPMPAHHLVAYGVDDGTLRWQRRVAHTALVEGAAVAATEAGTVGLDPRTGEVRWTREPEGVGARPAPLDMPDEEPPPVPHYAALPAEVLGGRVVAVPVPGEQAMETLLLDPATGRERARLEGSPLPQAVAGHGHDDLLVLRRGEGGRELVAVDADGRIQWEQRTDAEQAGGGSRSQTASIAGDVFAQTQTRTDTHLLVLDLVDGRVLHEEHLQHDRRVHPGALGRSSLLLHDEEAATAVGFIDGTELWRTRGAIPHGGVLSDAVLLQVGDELLAVEHDPRAARRDPRGR